MLQFCMIWGPPGTLGHLHLIPKKGPLSQEEAAGDPSAAGAQNRAGAATGARAQHVGATERLGEGQEKRRRRWVKTTVGFFGDGKW